MHPGIATGLLFLGWLVALLMAGTTLENRAFLLGVVSALGTVSAAGAAFWAASASARSAALTQQSLEHQKKRDYEASQPLLLATDALAKLLVFHSRGYVPYNDGALCPHAVFTLSITLTNMSAFSIYVWQFKVARESKGRHWDQIVKDELPSIDYLGYYEPPSAGYLIPPGQSFTHEGKFNAQVELEGTTSTVFFFNFQCSSTGHVRHFLSVPVSISAPHSDGTYLT